MCVCVNQLRLCVCVLPNCDCVCRSRTKNKMLYGILGGKEFFANSQKHLERKITLECDGHPVSLPSRLQGLVFLNIPSYMAGTNFWGTGREKRVSGVVFMRFM